MTKKRDADRDSTIKGFWTPPKTVSNKFKLKGYDVILLGCSSLSIVGRIQKSFLKKFNCVLSQNTFFSSMFFFRRSGQVNIVN